MVGSEEAVPVQDQIRSIMKPLQEQGIEIHIAGGKATPVLPEGAVLTPDKIKSLTDYLNKIAPELAGVGQNSSRIIAGSIEVFQNNPDPNYKKDMIMYGPSVENDYANARMQRLATVRQAITEAQMTSQPGPDRIGAIKAATFARAHLPDLGLTTTANFIRALNK